MTTIPPENQFRALVRLIYLATIEARAEAWQGENETDGALKERFSRIARLMDGIHNVPGFLVDYDGWDQGYFELCLGDKNSEIGKWLHGVYRGALADARKKSNEGEQAGGD